MKKVQAADLILGWVPRRRIARYRMLQTPATFFISLLTQHPDGTPVSFVPHADQLLVRGTDRTLLDFATISDLGIAAENWHPVGMSCRDHATATLAIVLKLTWLRAGGRAASSSKF